MSDLSAIRIDRPLTAAGPHGRWAVYVEHASDHAKEKVEVLSSPPGSPAVATPSLPKTPPARPGAPATTAKGAPPSSGGPQPRAPATKPAAPPAGSSKTAA